MPTPVEEREAELDAIIADYLEQQGRTPDRDEWLASHPRFRIELDAFLADRDRFEHVAAPLRAISGAEPNFGGVLGDFRIVREIGRGGMGVVYEAEQLSLGRRVALKTLPLAGMLDERQLQRFKNEARAAATLNHPNIVPVHAVGCERGVHFYAMQYIEGQTLAAVIEQMRNDECGMRNDSVGIPARRDGVPESPQDADSQSCPTAGCSELAVASFAGSAELTTDHSQPAVAGPLTTPPSDTSPIAALSTLRETKPRDFFRTIAELGIQAAEALDHAHDMGIVHRDIKPSNLMIECSHLTCTHLPGAPGRDAATPLPLRAEVGRGVNGSLTTDHRPLTTHLYITDFGLAHIESDASLTMTGDLLGTLRYMSPEQSEGKSAILDHRTDIYSLGITLYELLTLQPAFPATDRQTLLRQIAEQEPVPPRQIKPEIPADLETIVLKAISKDPADRYSSARELANDLSHFLKHEPIRARRLTVAQRAARWSRRHVAVVWSVAAVCSLLAVVLAGSTLFVLQERAQTAEALNKAKRSANLARDAVDNMYVDFAEHWIAEQPGLTEQQKTFLEKAAHYYEELMAEPDEDGISIGAIETLRRLGGAHERLSNASAAKAALERAVDLGESLLAADPANRDVQAALAEALGALARYSPDKVATYRRSVDLWEKSLDPRQVDVHRRKRFAETCSALAYELALKRQYSEADIWGDRGYQFASRLAETHPKDREANAALRDVIQNYALIQIGPAQRVRPGRREFAQKLKRQQIEIARTHGDLQKSLMDTGNFFDSPQCVEYLSEAITIWKKGVDQYPERPGIQYSLWLAYKQIAPHLFAVGKTDECVNVIREMIAIDKQLIPKKVLPDWILDCNYQLLSRVLARVGRLEERREALGRSRDLLEKRLEASRSQGDSPQYESIRNADLYVKLAKVSWQLGDADKANEYARQAIAEDRKLLPYNDGGSIDAMIRLAWKLITWPDPQLRDPDEAIRILRPLESEGPIDKAYSSAFTGLAHLRKGNWRECIEWLDRPDDQRERDHRPNLKAVEWLALAMAHWHLGHNVEAREFYEQAATWMDENVSNLDDTKIEHPFDLENLRAEAEQLLEISGESPGAGGTTPQIEQ